MWKKIILMILLFPTISKAAESVGVGPGLLQSQKGSFYGLNAVDMHYFDQIEQSYGVSHYGYGSSGIQIGNGIGINLMANSGIILHGLEENEGATILVGTDLGGKILMNSNSSIKSYYQWLPAMTLGPQFGFGKNRLAFLVKGGIAAGNYDKHGIMPDIYGSYGAGFYSKLGLVNLSADRILFGNNQVNRGSISLDFNKFELGLQAESWNNKSKGLTDNSANIILKTELH